MQIGTRVNRLELIGKEPKEHRIEEGAITEWWQDVEMTWKCDCGQTKVFWEKDLPKSAARLKMELNDCGCGISKPTAAAAPLERQRSERQGRPKGRHKVGATFTFSIETVQGLEDFAETKQV